MNVGISIVVCLPRCVAMCPCHHCLSLWFSRGVSLLLHLSISIASSLFNPSCCLSLYSLIIVIQTNPVLTYCDTTWKGKNSFINSLMHVGTSEASAVLGSTNQFALPRYLGHVWE